MHSAWKTVDYFIKAHILLLGAVFAHILSGGSVIGIRTFLPLQLLITVAIFLTRHINLDGPLLALMILVLQSGGHFILGAGNSPNDLRMSIGHLIGGVLSFHLIQRYEEFWRFVSDLSFTLLLPVLHLRVPQFFSAFPATNRNIAPSSIEFFSEITFRGPPNGAQL